MKKWILIIAVIAAAAALVRLLMPGDRARIMTAVTKGKTAIERENIDKVMSVVSIGYRDEYGFTYAALRKTFADMFGRLDNISLGCDIGDATIRGDTADVALDVSLSGTINGERYRIIGDGTPEPITVRFARDGLAWKAVGSRWENFPSVEALLGEGAKYFDRLGNHLQRAVESVITP